MKESFDGSIVMLEVTGADSELDSGDYKCLASNPSGKASHGARVTVDVDKVYVHPPFVSILDLGMLV